MVTRSPAIPGSASMLPSLGSVWGSQVRIAPRFFCLGKGGLEDDGVPSAGSVCGQSVRLRGRGQDSPGWSSLAGPIPTRSSRTKTPGAQDRGAVQHPIQRAGGGLSPSGTAPQRGEQPNPVLVLRGTACAPPRGLLPKTQLLCFKHSLWLRQN